MPSEACPTLQGHRCKSCGGHFKRTVILPQSVDDFIADMQSTTCPLCGAGVKSLSMGEHLSLIEDSRIRQPGSSERVRAANWVLQGEIGQSALSIHRHMTGADSPGGWPRPRDLDDLRRCILLMHHVPEWRGRIHEMHIHEEWAKLSEAFHDLERSYLDESPDLHGPAPMTARAFANTIGTSE